MAPETLGACATAFVMSILGGILIFAGIKDDKTLFGPSGRQAHYEALFGKKGTIAVRALYVCIGAGVALFSIGVAIKKILADGF